MSLLIKGAAAVARLAQASQDHLERMESRNVETKRTGAVDLGKVRQILDDFAAQQQVFAAAVDQLQQRVSNLEGLVARLEARLPVQKQPITDHRKSPIAGPGNFLDTPGR